MVNRSQSIWHYFQRHRIASIVLGHIILVSALGLVLAGGLFGSLGRGGSAQNSCTNSEPASLSGQTGQAYVLPVGHHQCDPKAGSQSVAQAAAAAQVGTGNPYPYGQCTYWANSRYHQVHGVFVPWTTNANAWQWPARANQFGWNVSSIPRVGTIIDLQPWVQGALGLGHVAFVERVLPNGHVIASNMNWASRYPSQIEYVEFAPGPGVLFISL